jgi:hypothetical protein
MANPLFLCFLLHMFFIFYHRWINPATNNEAAGIAAEILAADDPNRKYRK